MRELTIHNVPADLIHALEADAKRSNLSVEEVAKRVLSQYADRAGIATQAQQARLEIDRIRGQIERRYGKLDIVLPILRDDRKH